MLASSIVAPTSNNTQVEVPLIDAEFKALIPPLSDEEQAQLEGNILAEGCRDALVVWRAENILLDGHNRLHICTTHALPYRVEYRDFADRAEAIVWACRNQLGRRNLSSFARGELALRMKSAIAEEARKNLVTSTGGSNPQPLQNSAKAEHVDTRLELAKLAEVSHDTIRKVEKIAAAAPESVKQRARTGEISTHRAYELTRALESAGKRTRGYVEAQAIDDPELVKWLAQGEKDGREWFNELTTSGYIQPGKEDEAVALGAGLLALQSAVKAREKANREIAQLVRMDNAANRAGALPTGKYSVIYADPPWQYEYAETYNRAIENHYPTMTLDAICALPICEMAADDAVLFLWATNPKLAEAMRVIEAWGFEYRTNMVWVKPSIGMGYYVRAQHELLLIARRGELPVPLPFARPASVLNAPTSEHSRKPEDFYSVIERMYPDFPKVELFSRVNRAGWAGWGADYADAA